MDLVGFTMMTERFVNQMADDSSDRIYYMDQDTKNTIQIISIIVSLFAAYLSWSCSQQYSLFERIFFALFAGMFGTLYIIYYFTIRYDVCRV